MHLLCFSAEFGRVYQRRESILSTQGAKIDAFPTTNMTESSMSNNTFPDFDDLATVFWQSGSMFSPSRLQGQLMGELAVGAKPSVDEWLRQAKQLIDAVEPLNTDDERVLSDVFEASCALIKEGDLEVQLLVPCDETELSERVECLGLWCQGFLSGFAAAGKQVQNDKGGQQYSAVVSEALSDIAAIAQISLEDEEGGEKGEADLFEVLEYVRLAAINIYLECVSPDVAKKTAKDEASAVKTPANLFNKSLH